MDNEKQFTITENGVLIECISDSTEITIPKEVTSIEEGAFEECEKLTSVIIPGTVKTIGAYSFFCLTQLKSVKLGEGVTSIENFVFFIRFLPINSSSSLLSPIAELILPLTISSAVIPE